MSKKMFIESGLSSETRMAVTENEKLVEYESEIPSLKPTRGNIYLAKIIRVEPSLQAAFVDYGSKRHGFLAYNEIHPDYFKIPTADKEKLLAQEEASQNFMEEENTNDEVDFQNKKGVDDISKNNPKNKEGDGFIDKVLTFFNFRPLKEDFEVKTNQLPMQVKSNEIRKNKPNPYSFHRKYSIQEVIKKNQVILIQVVKEERGNKGAAVTTRLSLAGKYCVLMPNTNKGGGISRKINDVKLRTILKDTLTYLKIKKGMGVIIRTAGQSMKKSDISRDYKALLKLWSQITEKTIKSTAPSLIHEEGNLLKRSVRDYFSSEFSEILVNSKDTLNSAKEIMKFFMPGFTKFIKLDNNKKNTLFSTQKIEHQILEMYKPIVNLKSGGYLVINQTEALVAIDVNSGKSTKQRNIEDTATKTNLEASEAIASQLKLRDLAGLIVIDFIDMLERGNNYKVERKLRESIKNDRARIQCGRISSFGLLEMSRQRLKQSINKSITSKCSHCNEFFPSTDFSSNQILKVCEEKLLDSKLKKISLFVSSNVGKSLEEENKKYLMKLQSLYKIDIKVMKFKDFNNLDCVIHSKNEIIYNNCNNEEKLSLIMNMLESEEQTSETEKQKVKIKKDKVLKKKNEKSYTKVNKSDEFSIQKIENIPAKKSRTSYRTKADSFNIQKFNNDNLEIGLKNKQKIKKTNIQKIIKNNPKDKVEKRNGWWNQ